MENQNQKKILKKKEDEGKESPEEHNSWSSIDWLIDWSTRTGGRFEHVHIFLHQSSIGFFAVFHPFL